MASNHECHPVLDDEFLFLDGYFFELFFLAQEQLLGEGAQSSIELAVALKKLLKFFAFPLNISTRGRLFNNYE